MRVAPTGKKVPMAVREAAERARAAAANGEASPPQPFIRATSDSRTHRQRSRVDEAPRSKRRARKEGIGPALERFSKEPTAGALRELLQRANHHRNPRGVRDVVRHVLQKALPALAPRIHGATAADTALLMEAIGKLAAHRKSIEMRRALMDLLLARALEIAESFDPESLARACKAFGGGWLHDAAQVKAALFFAAALPGATAMVPTLAPRHFSAIAYAAGQLPLDKEGRDRARAFMEALIPHAIGHAHELAAIELTCTIAPFERLVLGEGPRRQAAELVKVTLPRIPLPTQTSALLSIVRRSLSLPLDDDAFREVARFVGRMLRAGRVVAPELTAARIESLGLVLEELQLHAARTQEFMSYVDRTIQGGESEAPVRAPTDLRSDRGT